MPTLYNIQCIYQYLTTIKYYCCNALIVMLQQVLLMKINFDEIAIDFDCKRTSNSISPVKVKIQSPVYNQITQEFSPHNFENQITRINSVINLPSQVSRFIVQQIGKQINETADQDEINKINYFMRHTQSLQNLSKYQNKNEKSTFSNTLRSSKQSYAQKVYKTIKRDYKVKKHQCEDKLNMSARNILNEINQLTYKPRLYKNAYNQKISMNREFESRYGLKNKNVYQTLYEEANNRKFRTQLQKEMIEQRRCDAKPKINSNYFKNSKSNYISLNNRVDQILQQKTRKQKQKQKLDLTTGKQLFKLDLTGSKDSYKIFANSLSKQKLQLKIRKGAKNVNSNKKQQGKLLNLKKTLVQQNVIDIKTIQYFTQIFYPPEENSFTQSKAIQTSSTIKKQQFIVLHPFLHQIEQLESKKYQIETTVSSTRVSNNTKAQGVLSKQDFQAKLWRYYKNLSLHDRQILRSEILKRRRIQNHKNREQQPIQQVFTFTPSINIRSSSLDNLANGHSAKIYYI